MSNQTTIQVSPTVQFAFEGTITPDEDINGKGTIRQFLSESHHEFKKGETQSLNVPNGTITICRL